MMNKCIFIGRLGGEPKVSDTGNGVKVAQFSIACDERGYTTKDGKTVEKRTEWIPVVLWRGLAETAGKYLKKGMLISIEGKFRTRSYEKDGVTFYRSEIFADSMNMLDAQREKAPLPTEHGAAAGPVEAPQADDDLPF